MDEIELKAVVPDPAACRTRLEGAGARLTFVGRLEDRRWDLPTRPLARRDEVVRVRRALADAGAPGESEDVVDWKGPTRRVDGYKVRAERSTRVGDAAVLELVLQRAGFVVTREVDRRVVQYALDGAAVRLEWYPAMDVLVEVEGTPLAIERAIAATGLPRARFGTGSLADFAAAYERRTGVRAALSARELAGDYPFGSDDA